MKFTKTTFTALLSVAMACAVPSLVSCGGKDKTAETAKADTTPAESAPKQDAAPAIDKSSDAALQEMIRTVAPKFSRLEYKDSCTGRTMKYSLYSPAKVDDSKKYPIVLFIADASTVGGDAARALTQGYGALVWATDAWQAEHPCYVLVPQFEGVAVNDAYEHTDEVDVAVRLLDEVVSANKVDTGRIYATGQSMGGMIAMYYNVAYPDLFAASIFVDSHWNPATFPELVKHKFIYFIAGDSGKAYADLKPMEEAAEKVGVGYTFSSWSAQLPEARQSELAGTMLEKGAPVNFFQFEPGTVLPADGKGSEHMYSFDYAYKIPSVREWLFKQKK